MEFPQRRKDFSSDSLVLPPPIPKQNLEEAKWLAANLKSVNAASPASSQEEEIQRRSIDAESLPSLQPFHFDDQLCEKEDFSRNRFHELLQEQFACDGPQWEALKSNCDNSNILAEADDAIQSLRSWREKQNEEFSMSLERQLAEIDEGASSPQKSSSDESDELAKKVEEQLAQSNTKGQALQSIMKWHQEQQSNPQQVPKLSEYKESNATLDDEKLEQLQKDISALRIKKMIHDIEISAQADGSCLQRNERVLNEEAEFGIGAINMEVSLKQYSSDLDQILQQIDRLEDTSHQRMQDNSAKKHEAP